MIPKKILLSLLVTTITLIVCPSPVLAQADGQSVPAPLLHRAKIANKIKTIIIDKVNFDKADIAVVLDFLTKKCKELDPDKEGINFVLQLPDPVTASTTDPNPKPRFHREFSATLDEISLIDLLSEISSQTNLQYSIEDYAIVFHPIK